MELRARERVLGAGGAQRAALGREAPVRREHVRLGRDVDQLTEARMRDLAVVALEEVLAHDLPVGLDLGLPAPVVDERCDVEPELGDLRRQRAERLREQFRVRAHVDEDERPPCSDRSRQEPELLARKAGLFVRPRRAAECAVEPVRPRVVRALERLAGLLSLGDGEAAVAADVDEAAQHAVEVARDDDRRPAHLGREVAGLRELPGVADVLPGRSEDPLLLAAQDLRIRVPGVRQRRLHRGERTRLFKARLEPGSGRVLIGPAFGGPTAHPVGGAASSPR